MSTAAWLIAGAVTAAASAVAGGTISTVGAVQQHRQEKENAKAAEEQALYNKRVADAEARRVEAATEENTRRMREEAEALKARQIALLGKSGAAISSGSPLAILGRSAADSEQKIRDMRYAGYGEAQQYKEQGKMFGYSAGIAKASRPSGAGLAMTVAGNTANTVASVAGVGADYTNYKMKLKK